MHEYGIDPNRKHPLTGKTVKETAKKLKDITQQPHYTCFPIQPISYIVENGLDFLEGNVIKYVSRYKHKNGLEDLRKAKHYIEMLIQREEHKDVKLV
jgi:hypothetical protein